MAMKTRAMKRGGTVKMMRGGDVGARVGMKRGGAVKDAPNKMKRGGKVKKK